MADNSDGIGNAGNISGVGPTTSDDLYTIVTENVTLVVTGSPGSNRCSTIDYNYDIITAVICAMCFLFGIVYTFFGEFNFLLKILILK